MREQPKAGSQAPQRITCGGGGAFLHGTHQLPNPPKPINVGGTRHHYKLAAVYPDKKVQRTWRLRATPESTSPRFMPASDELELQLIEPPIEILRGGITP